MKDLKQTYTLHYHLREPYPHKEDIVCTLKWSPNGRRKTWLDHRKGADAAAKT